MVQMGLSGYFLVARTPLGNDLFSYSFDDIQTTIRGAGISLRIGPVVLGLIALAVLWLGLWAVWQRHASAGKRTIFALVPLVIIAWFLPLQGEWLRGLDLDTRTRAQDKTGFFLQSVVQISNASHTSIVPTVTAQEPVAVPHTQTAATNPEFPFIRPDRTPDALAPYFSKARRAPSVVFVIVEGLGRDFSGPNARLGSFTPFLDELASQSLYFEHFIAPQGRTFGVLPSLFGSLPFANKGFADLGDKMPAHDDLFSVLKANGYDTRFYSGANLDFDNERIYLRRQGVGKLRDLETYKRNHTLPANSTSWGFPDGELIRFVLADEAKEVDTPSVVGMQTISMHTDYRFPDQERFRKQVMERVRELGIPESRWQPYRDNLNIFSAILYTDEALRHFFERARTLPGYADTVYIVTGDHRLPELPMSDTLERHHVPLLIYSPLLKKPARIRAVSSHFDVAPSLLALLSHSYGLRTPTQVAWLGKGLDMYAEHRNLQDIPIKPVKGEGAGMLSGDWFLLRDQLYSVSPQLSAEASSDTQARSSLQYKLDTYNAANQRMIAKGSLLPPEVVGQLAPWNTDREQSPVVASNPDLPTRLLVRDVQADGAHIRATFVNTGGQASKPFVPLLVITDSKGRDLGEVNDKPLQLKAGDAQTLQLVIPPHLLKAEHFLAVIPADPDSGKRVGEGVFHIPLAIK